MNLILYEFLNWIVLRSHHLWWVSEWVSEW